MSEPLSRRDLRTKPGVLTPSHQTKITSPQRGGRGLLGSDALIHETADTCLPPLWGGRFFHPYPALKPWAESSSAFGTKSPFLNERVWTAPLSNPPQTTSVS
jgi:hypothetical protein